MAIRVAINGFGRIGRLVLRAVLEQAAATTSRSSPSTISARSRPTPICCATTPSMATFPGEVKTADDGIDLGVRLRCTVTAERDPAKLPWRELEVDVALECTGLFTKREKAEAHLTAGAKRVLISAPGDRCRPDGGLRRQPRRAGGRATPSSPTPPARPIAWRRSPQVLHQTVGIAARLHDHHPLLYRRSADGRHPAQGSCYRGRAAAALDDPDLDRGGQGHRPRAAGAQRQARRHRRSACRRPMSR